MSTLETLREDLLRRAARMIDGRYFGSGAPLPADLVQQVFSEMTANGMLAELEARSAIELRRYAFRALHSRFLNHCVRKRREGALCSDDVLTDTVSDEPAPDDAVIEREHIDARRTALMRALGGMSEQERAFLIAYLETGSAPAAQRQTGHPPGGSSNACEHRRALYRRLTSAIQEMPW